MKKESLNNLELLETMYYSKETILKRGLNGD